MIGAPPAKKSQDDVLLVEFPIIIMQQPSHTDTFWTIS